MKKTLDLIFRMMGFTVTVGAVIILALMGLNEYNMIPESLSPLRRDPVYQVNINGDVPQLVYQTKVNDDVKPDIYQVWYNPKTKMYSDFIIEVD